MRASSRLSCDDGLSVFLHTLCTTAAAPIAREGRSTIPTRRSQAGGVPEEAQLTRPRGGAASCRVAGRVCPNTAIYVSSDYYISLYMCLHTATYVSSHCGAASRGAAIRDEPRRPDRVHQGASTAGQVRPQRSGGKFLQHLYFCTSTAITFVLARK